MTWVVIRNLKGNLKSKVLEGLTNRLARQCKGSVKAMRYIIKMNVSE